jgi:hypothetical protein
MKGHLDFVLPAGSDLEGKPALLQSSSQMRYAAPTELWGFWAHYYKYGAPMELGIF